MSPSAEDKGAEFISGSAPVAPSRPRRRPQQLVSAGVSPRSLSEKIQEVTQAQQPIREPAHRMASCGAGRSRVGAGRGDRNQYGTSLSGALVLMLPSSSHWLSVGELHSCVSPPNPPVSKPVRLLRCCPPALKC